MAVHGSRTTDAKFRRWVRENIDDVGLNISRGLIDGISHINKFGRNIDVDTGSETVWEGGGIINYSATANISHIVSSSASDTFNVTVVGLDTNWNEVEQTVALAGTDGQALTTSLRRCYRMWNASATAAVGTVQCGVSDTTSSFSAANLRAQITIGYEQSLMAVYTVPANKTAYLVDWFAEIDKASGAGAVDFSIFAREDGGVFRIKEQQGTQTTGSSVLNRTYTVYPSFPGKTDIEIRAEGSTTNFDISAGFDLILVDN